MAQSKTLTISWWGFNGDKLNEFIVKPFQAKCGCELVFETGNNADRLNKIKIRNGEGGRRLFATPIRRSGFRKDCSRRSMRRSCPISQASMSSPGIRRAATDRPTRSAVSV